MAKLSTIFNLIGSYLAVKGDKDVTSIGSVCGRSETEYILHLHDVFEGEIGYNPYTGKDEIFIPKKDPKYHFTEGRAEELLGAVAKRMAKETDENSAIYELLSSGFTETELIEWLGFDKMKVMSLASMIRTGIRK